TLWPNPASDKANLHFNRKVADVDISILTMSGEVVFQTTYSGVRDVSIPVADLPQGTYMVVAEWEGKRMVTQMVHI
ncbi:MAG TPA: T9SS type A sorting domain-containing protein, partial [Chitinophagales bacterium]|nr:T9SS type A sorting domain-containing protein [Chitinophagales bacterium]